MISVVDLVGVLIVVGVALYLVEHIPMDATVKHIIRVVVILAVVLWLLQSLGVIESLKQYRIGR